MRRLFAAAQQSHPPPFYTPPYRPCSLAPASASEAGWWPLFNIGDGVTPRADSPYFSILSRAGKLLFDENGTAAKLPTTKREYDIQAKEMVSTEYDTAHIRASSPPMHTSRAAHPDRRQQRVFLANRFRFPTPARALLPQHSNCRGHRAASGMEKPATSASQDSMANNVTCDAPRCWTMEVCSGHGDCDDRQR